MNALNATSLFVIYIVSVRILVMGTLDTGLIQIGNRYSKGTLSISASRTIALFHKLVFSRESQFEDEQYIIVAQETDGLPYCLAYVFSLEYKK